MTNETILYLSDQATNSNSVLAALKATGCEVVSTNSAAQAIANALDQIAQQIREGGLTVPSPGGALNDPRAIAATLAALLGVKR